MKIKYILSFILVMFIFLPSCGEDTKTTAKKVNKLEILAIKVDKPQAHAGENIIAESLVGYPELYDNEFHTIWFLCNPIGDMGIQSCMSEEGFIGLPAIDANKFNFTIPTDVLSSQNLGSKKLYAVFIICEANMDKCQGSLMSKNSNQFDSDIFKISYKTIEVIKDDSPIANHNPKIKSIYLNGTKLTSNEITLKASDDRDNNIFKAEVTSNSFDEIKTPKGEKDYETIAFAWKSTLGDISYYYTDQKYNETTDDLDENPFKTALNTENETYHLYIIAIDSRGGIDWKTLNITNEK